MIPHLLLAVACTSPTPPPDPIASPEHPEPPPPPVTYADQGVGDAEAPLPLDRNGPIVAVVRQGSRTRAVLFTETGPEPLKRSGVRDVHRTPSGAVWLLSDALERVDGSTPLEERIPLDDMVERPGQVAFDHTGRVWLASRDAVGRWDGEHWVQTGFDALAKEAGVEEVGSPRDLRVDAKGALWMTTLEGVFRFADGSWTSHPLPDDDLPGLLTDGPDGVSVGSIAGRYDWSGTGWVAKGELDVSDGLDQQGDAILEVASAGPVVVRRGGTESRTARPEGAARLTSGSIDSQGRAWFASEVGLHVFTPKDADAQGVITWPTASDPVWMGDIEHVLAIGAGPASLPEPRPVQTLTLNTTLTRGGKPVPNTPIELCSQPQMLFRGSTPCDGSFYRASAISDGDGKLAFENVPKADLRITWKEDGKWASRLGGSFDCCAKPDVDEVDLEAIELP